jgi:hypothetical protein
MSFNLVPKDIKSLNLENVVKFTSPYKSKDKILRFIQYYLKFAVYQMQQADPKSDTAKRLGLLTKGIGLHRKAFKLGQWLDEAQKLVDLLNNGKSGLKQNLDILLRPVMFVFLIFDNLVYFASLKVSDGDKDALKMKAYKCRLTAALIQVAASFLDFQKQSKVVAKAAPEEKSKAMDKHGQVTVTLVKNCFDVVTYSASAKFIELTDGQAGMVGATSSALAMYTIWCK